MSGVVLRCPNCGTTQSAQGQCEACHEAAVRFFCRNHEPGLWLVAAACPLCGARFGDPVPPRLRESRPVERPTPSPSPARQVPPIESDPGSAIGPWGAGPPAERRGSGPAPDPLRVLLGAMAAAARARSERTMRAGYGEPSPARRGGGCVARIFMLILFLAALFLMLPILLGGFFRFG